MTARRDPDRLIRAFLDEGPTELPARSYDTVRAEIDSTRQRVVFGPWREPRMPSLTRIAIGAAALLAVAVIGISLLPGLLPGQGQFGAPGPTPTPTVTPTPVPIGASRSLQPDTTYLVEDPLPYTMRVPQGWQVQGGGYMVKVPSGTSEDAMMSLNAWLVDNVYPDPCRPDQGPADPPVGPGVDDLVAALAQQFAGDGSTSDVTIDGFSGQKLELSVPPDVTSGQCNGFEVGRWQSAGGTGGFGGYIHGAGQHDTVYVLDVQGERVVIHASYLPATPAADREDLQAIVDTIDFLP